MVQRCTEAEDNWFTFKKMYDIYFVNWREGSSEHRVATQLVTRYVNLRGHYLRDAVLLTLEIDQLDKEAKNASEEYVTYLLLKEKFKHSPLA